MTVYGMYVSAGVCVPCCPCAAGRGLKFIGVSFILQQLLISQTQPVLLFPFPSLPLLQVVFFPSHWFPPSIISTIFFPSIHPSSLCVYVYIYMQNLYTCIYKFYIYNFCYVVHVRVKDSEGEENSGEKIKTYIENACHLQAAQ